MMNTADSRRAHALERLQRGEAGSGDGSRERTVDDAVEGMIETGATGHAHDRKRGRRTSLQCQQAGENDR